MANAFHTILVLPHNSKQSPVFCASLEQRVCVNYNQGQFALQYSDTLEDSVDENVLIFILPCVVHPLT